MFKKTSWYTLFYWPLPAGEELEHEKIRFIVEKLRPAVKPTFADPSPGSNYLLEAMIKAFATRSFCSPLREPSPVDGLPSPVSSRFLDNRSEDEISVDDSSLAYDGAAYDGSIEISDSDESEPDQEPDLNPRASKTPKWSPQSNKLDFT